MKSGYLNVAVVAIAHIDAIRCARGGEAENPSIDDLHDLLSLDLFVLPLKKLTRLVILS